MIPVRKSALFLFGLVVAALVALGLIVLSSAGVANGLRLHGDQLYFMKRQFMYLGVGLLVVFCTAKFDYCKWREHWTLVVFLYCAVFVLLLAVFGFKAINGSHRWIALGPIRLQPSEFAKLAIVIAVSVWMDKAGWRVELFKRGACCPALLIGVLAAPVVFEPDFGSTMVIGMVGFMIMFVAGTRLLHLLPLLLCGGGVVLYKILTNENRVRRIAAWLASFFGLQMSDAVGNAPLDPAAYQATMSLVALRNGGLWGVGLGESMQKHAYLPEAHTDFIFAVGAEELGVFFSIGVVLLFFLFFILSIYIARKSTDRLGRFLVIGMSFLVFFQAMFNLGVVCEALPTKGMALPFFSYGGTNLISTFFAVGTILSVGIHSFSDRKRRLTTRRSA